ALSLVKVCHKRGTFAMGGMAAQIPIKNDEVAMVDPCGADGWVRLAAVIATVASFDRCGWIASKKAKSVLRYC
ncbi:MAG: hypothetical protein ACKO15_00630, partial [Burkholderiales bacterium]